MLLIRQVWILIWISALKLLRVEFKEPVGVIVCAPDGNRAERHLLMMWKRYSCCEDEGWSRVFGGGVAFLWRRRRMLRLNVCLCQPGSNDATFSFSPLMGAKERRLVCQSSNLHILNRPSRKHPLIHRLGNSSQQQQFYGHLESEERK